MNNKAVREAIGIIEDYENGSHTKQETTVRLYELAATHPPENFVNGLSGEYIKELRKLFLVSLNSSETTIFVGALCVRGDFDRKSYEQRRRETYDRATSSRHLYFYPDLLPEED